MTKPNNLSPKIRPKDMHYKPFPRRRVSFYDEQGRRLFVNLAERTRFADIARRRPAEIKCFCGVLYFTGCRLSEAIELKASSIELESGVITFRTLKKKKATHMRSVPVPGSLLRNLSKTFDLPRKGNAADELLWTHRGKQINRTKGYRWIKAVMDEAQIEGQMATPKGFRHGYAHLALNAGVQLSLVQKLMGHSSIEVTAGYTDSMMWEERILVARMWQFAADPIVHVPFEESDWD
ncbi:MAG: site-specific integrase [Pseudomonadota bacterium]